MAEDEVIRMAHNKRRTGTGLPRHESGRQRSKDAEVLSGGGQRRRDSMLNTSGKKNGQTAGRRATLFGINEVFDGERSIESEIWGVFPRGFIDFALRALNVPADDVLHVCSGSLTHRDVAGGLRVDIDYRRDPDFVADGRDLSFPDGMFSGVLIDPPYTEEYAWDLYDVEYPRPSALLREAARVVKPGGVVGFVHFLVPKSPPELVFRRVYGVMQGLGYRIRAFTIYERLQAELL